MMCRIDLFEKAQENVAIIESQYEAIKTQPGITAIAQYVQTYARISVNRQAQPLLELLRDKRLLSGYRDAQRRGEKFKDYLRRKWKNAPPKFIRRRVAFSCTFKKGKDFLFGALNAGGAGAAAKNGVYGYYCLVFKDIMSTKSVAYCKKDTLAEDEYWTCSKKESHCSGCSCDVSLNDLKCRVNFDTLLPDYAPHSHRGRLAVIKHQHRINRVLSSVETAKLLIEDIPNRTEEYIEACFFFPVSRDHIEQVRFHRGMAIDILDEALMDPQNPNGKVSFIRQHQEIVNLLKHYSISYTMEF